MARTATEHLADVRRGMLVEWTDERRAGKIAKWVKWNGRGQCLVELDNGEQVYTRAALLKIHKAALPIPILSLPLPPPAPAPRLPEVSSKVIQPPLVMPVHVAELLKDTEDDTSLEKALLDGEHDPATIPTPSMRATAGNIYVFYDPKTPDRCKVGAAINIERRLRAARTYNPDMVCFQSLHCPIDYMRAEGIAHALLSRWWINQGGPKEWFQVDPNEAAQACLRARKILLLAK